MRRNVASVVKFLLMALCVVSLTVFTFKIVRPLTLPEHKSQYARFEALHQQIHAKRDKRKIDWHDYKKIHEDQMREGIGERGVPASLSSSEDDIKEELYKVNGFNAALSDKISLHRSLPDIRHEGCQRKNYSYDLPTVSVVVPFHNEHWTTLLRTAYSVIDRSPSHLLKEIILVDDFSSKDFLKEKLDKYVSDNMPKVHVIHLPARQGLILARLAGARAATGEVLIFLDSHTEANVNWLPPLLDPIADDYRTCVCPFIDVVAYDTFEYRAQDEGARGAFDWEMYYKRLPLLDEDKENPTEPFRSPVMAGGLFAITARFFWELGGYDDGLDIWGGEQYELSFKIWQCGGTMVDAPCSRIGHIYRKFSPFPNPGRGDFVGKNYKRVAEVWMDEYAEFLYQRRPHYRDIDPGDLTKQKALRKSLNCKPFKWFMKEIAFDLPKKYPPIEPADYANGEIRSDADPSLCVDTAGGDTVKKFGVQSCFSDHPDAKGAYEQQFRLGWMKDIRPKVRASWCFDVSDSGERAPVTLFGCHGYGGNQMWKYNPDTKQLVHGGNPRCLEVNVLTKEIFVTKCNVSSKYQRWNISHVNLEQLEKWGNVDKLVDIDND